MSYHEHREINSGNPCKVWAACNFAKCAHSAAEVSLKEADCRRMTEEHQDARPEDRDLFFEPRRTLRGLLA
jgi:hypothetical protein